MKRCKWTYIHSLNSVSKTTITKHGEYVGKIKHTATHWENRRRGTKWHRRGRPVQMARVHFDGNERCSIVPFDALEIYTELNPAGIMEENDGTDKQK